MGLIDSSDTNCSWAAAARTARLWTIPAWDAFLRDTVTPRFPDGLTVLDAHGQWRDSEGAVQSERSKVLVILVPADDDGTHRIDEVSDEYKRRFMQEAVLRVVDDACVVFS